MPPSSQSRIFLGVGLSTKAEPADVIALAEEALKRAGSVTGSIVCVATIASRRGHQALDVLARHFGCDISFFDVAALEAETSRLKNPSETLFARIGCHGVAEAAALAAAGRAAILVVEKMDRGGATAAIALQTAVF